MESSREKFFITNTMICLLKAIEGKTTTVELRNEREVTGCIDSVDGFMNITMSDVVYKCNGKTDKKYSNFFVNGKNIRYVHIPDEVDMRKAMKSTLVRYCTRTANLRVKEEIQKRAWEKMKKKETAYIKEEKMNQKLRDWDNVSLDQNKAGSSANLDKKI